MEAHLEVFLMVIRYNKNVSLRELEKKTGISRSTLSNIENGNTTPNVVQLEKIAKVLDVPAKELYTIKFLDD